MSDHCETRSYGTFLTRSLFFDDEDDVQTFEAVENFYSDALCRSPAYRIHTRGNYSLAGQMAFDDTAVIQFKVINNSLLDYTLLVL